MFEHLRPCGGARVIGIVAAGRLGGLAALPGLAAAASSCRLESGGESLIAQARARLEVARDG